MGGRTRGAYPKTLAEFHRRFPDDEACLRYLVETRWPDGFRCPGCGSANAGLLSTRRVWQCRACRRQTSATAGTVLHRTRQPLTAWFTAAYLMTSLKPGISALQLQHQLGLASFGTTWVLLHWVLLHKLRRAMVDPDHAGSRDSGAGALMVCSRSLRPAAAAARSWRSTALPPPERRARAGTARRRRHRPGATSGSRRGRARSRRGR